MRDVRWSRWLLPIAVLAMVALLGFRTVQHLGEGERATPTATPSASATPPPTKVPTPTRAATSQPSPTVVQVTVTPPPVHSVRTGGITYDMAYLRALQVRADQHAADYALDPVRVTVHDLPQFGFSPGPIEVVSPAPPSPSPTSHHGEDGLPETDVIVRYRGKRYWIVLNQFVRAGPGGIWSVITITPM